MSVVYKLDTDNVKTDRRWTNFFREIVRHGQFYIGPTSLFLACDKELRQFNARIEKKEKWVDGPETTTYVTHLCFETEEDALYFMLRFS